MTPTPVPPSTESSCFENTKKILWKNPKQDIGYQDYVAEDNGAIVMCAGGYCVGKAVEDWVELAWPKSERGLQAYRQQSAPDEGEIEKTLSDFKEHVAYSDFADFKKEGGDLLRNGDVVVSVNDNNMSVYEDCHFTQQDSDCDCYVEAKSYLRRTTSFIFWCFQNAEKMLSYILFLQSRLKQAEAERDSYMEDAEMMHEALMEIWHDRNVWPELAKNYDRKDMMDIAEKALSSLSNYPPNK